MSISSVTVPAGASDVVGADVDARDVVGALAAVGAAEVASGVVSDAAEVEAGTGCPSVVSPDDVSSEQLVAPRHSSAAARTREVDSTRIDSTYRRDRDVSRPH